MFAFCISCNFAQKKSSVIVGTTFSLKQKLVGFCSAAFCACLFLSLGSNEHVCGVTTSYDCRATVDDVFNKAGDATTTEAIKCCEDAMSPAIRTR